MQVSSPASVSSLFLIADWEGQIRQHLRSSIPASSGWRVTSFDSSADAAQVAPYEAPNLAVIVCRQVGDLLCSDLIALLDHAKRHWPHTFFILASANPLKKLDVLFGRFGEMPVVDLADPQGVSQTIEREMESSAYGTVRGVSLPSFLQMMEWEHKTLAIRVSSGGTWGRLHLLGGRLVNAYSHRTGRTGEAAALDILAWEGVSVEIERSYHNGQPTQIRPLTALLMDAMRLKDERGARDVAPEASTPAPPAEEDEVFRRPRSSTAHLKKPQYEAACDVPVPPSPSVAPAAADAGPPPSPQLAPGHSRDQREINMANVKETLNAATSIDGAAAAALVDYSSGMALGTIGSGINLELAAAGNTEVVRAKMRTMEMLGIQGEIEDILITLQSQYHIIYIVPNQPLFLYLVLAKDKANLAMARYKLKSLGSNIVIA